MHGHYLLKLTATLAWVRKMPLYSIIFVQKFCTQFNGYYICIWPQSVVYLSWIIYAEIVLSELFEESHQSFSAQFFSVSKVSAGNSGHPKTPDIWYISAMDESFGLKLLVLKHLALGYIQTKNELKAQTHCTANQTFVLKMHFSTLKNVVKLWKQAGIY